MLNIIAFQPIGINAFRAMPQKIGQFLNLSDHHCYTGHCLRRTSATFLADAGVDIQILKRHGGWLSNATAEGYVENSVQNRMRTSAQVFKYVSSCSSMSSSTDEKNVNGNIENCSPNIMDNIVHTLFI